jgi:hypothetical protein
VAASDSGWCIAEGGECHRQIAHAGAIAGITFVGRGLQAAVQHIAADTATTGVADIDRLAVEPGDEGVSGAACIPAAACDDRVAKSERHLRIVGDLPGFEPQPAAAADVTVHAEDRCDLALQHEFDGRAQRIADGQSQIGAQCAFVNVFPVHAVRDNSGAPGNRRR